MAISEKDIAILRDMRDRVARIEKIVAQGDDAGRGSMRRRRTPYELAPRWFRISASSADGSNKRWVYTLVEVYKSTAGYNGWADVTGGITTTYGYNGIEDQNGATGTYGVNIASTNLTGTFALKPLYTGCRVFAYPVAVYGSANMEWWFDVSNQVDGQCA